MNIRKIYVSDVDGDDSWTGADPDSNTSGTGPFKTLQHARDVASSTDITDYIQIIIREGTYSFTTPFILTSSNSGSSSFTPLTFKAYDDEIVKLCAATTLDSTLFSLVTSASDSAIYNRLNTSAKGKVYVYNLGSAINVGNFTTYWNGAWTNQADQLTNTYDEYLLSSKYRKGSDLPPLPEISIDGELLTLARWPSTGYAEMKMVVEAGSSTGSDCDCVGDATTTCVGKTPCYDATTDLCNYKYYTGTNAYLKNRIPKIPWGIDGIFEYNDADAAVIAKWPDPSTYEMYIYGPVSFDFSAEGMKILEINKTNNTIKVNSHRSKYGIIQFNDACYGRAYSTTGLNCNCLNSSGVETIPGYTQLVYDSVSATCVATASYQESNDNLATRKLSSSPQRWRRDYWSDPHPRRWFALNILEELNSAGQYYIDRATKKLYVWPKTPITSSSKVLISKVSGYGSDNTQTAYESDRLQSVIKITGASNIKFENIEICDTSGHGIDIIGSNNITLKNCNIYNTRKTGIRILGGTSNNVDGCNIFDTGTSGIRLSGGNKITLEPSKNIIQNCDITRTCLNVRGETMVAAIQMHGVGNTIRKNKIYNLSTQAIGHSGNNNIIEYNNIHDVILECDDCGAVYSWANISNRGNICRYNLFRNIQNKLRAVPQFPSANADSCNSNPTSVDPNGDSNAMKDGWFGHCAIYFDNFATGMTITGNIFYRCGNKNGKASMGAIFVNYGIDVIASNNIFVDCPLAVGSNPNRAYYDSPIPESTTVINARQISTGGNNSWEVALNDKPNQYNDSGAAPCCRTPTPGNFNGWSVLLNWNGITLGTANDVAFIQNPKLFEYNFKELGYLSQCDIRSTVYTNQYPELLGSKSDTPTSFLYFDTTEDVSYGGKIKVNANYPRKNYADRNVFVQTPYKTSTYSSWNQVIKTWDTTNDQVITKIEDAGFVDIANGDFRLNSDSPILSNTLFDPIPVQDIAGYYDDIQEQEVVLDFSTIPLYFERMDGIATWPNNLAVDYVGIPSESKYLKSNLETRKYIMLNHVGFWDSTNTRTTSINHKTDPVGAINQLKAADLTNTVKNELIMLAQQYNTYHTNLNKDTVGGTKPITEHLGEIPLIVFCFEAPMIGLILDVANTRAGIDATYGIGTWQKAIDFLSAMIPEAKRLLADSSFTSANKIPSFFTKAKFSHYAMPHAVTNVSLNGKPYALNTNSQRRAIRTKLIGNEYFGKIIESCDFFAPSVYAYWPMSSTNPGGCSGTMTTNNIYGRNFQKQTIYDNVILFNEWMSATGIVKDIYPMLSYAYTGDYWDYFWYYNCTNIAFDPTNITKEFWGSRRISDEDAVETMKICVAAGKTAVKGFLYWSSSYTTGPTYRLTSPCLTTRLKSRAVYAKDVNTALIPYINVDSYWPAFTTGSCVESFTSNATGTSTIGNNSPSINPIVAATVSATGSGGPRKIVKNSFISDQISNQADPADSIVVTMSNLKIELIKTNNQHVDIIRDASSLAIGAPSIECCFAPCTCSSAGDLNKCCWNNQTCVNNYCSKLCYGGTGALPGSCCKCRRYYTDFKVASGDAVEVIASGCVYPISDKNINYVDGVYTSGIPVTTQNPNGGYPDNGWVKCEKANGDFVLRPWINGDVECGCLSGETMFDDSTTASPLYGSVSVYLPNGIGGWSTTPTQVFIASSLPNNDSNKHDVGGIFQSDDLCALTGFLNKNGFDEYDWCNSEDYPTCFVPQALTLEAKSHSHFCYSSCDCATGNDLGQASACDSSCTTWVYSNGQDQYFCNTLSYSDCMTWSICKERGCCVQCPTSCTPANCTDYYNCSALTGKYASGGLCDATAGKSCSGLCGTNNFCTSTSSGRCSRVSKPDWDICMLDWNPSNPSTGGCLCKNCCGDDPCDTYARTGKPGDSTYWDYWRCESDPACKASKCITKDCTKDCPVDPCNVAEVILPFKYPRGMTVAFGKLYVAGAHQVAQFQFVPSVTIINLSTRKIINTLIGTAGSSGLVAIVYRPSTNRIYAVGTGGSMCINPSNDTIDSTVSLGSGVRLIHDVDTDYLIGLRSNFREGFTVGNTLFKVDFSHNVTAGPTTTFTDIDNLTYIPQEGGYISVNGTTSGSFPAISRITWNGTSYSAVAPTSSSNTSGFSVYAPSVNRLYTGGHTSPTVSNITITKTAQIGVTNFSFSIASTTRLTSATYSSSTNKIYVSAFGKIAIITPNTAYNDADFTTSLPTNINSNDIFYDSITDRVYFTGTQTTSNSTPYLKIINPYTQQLDDMVSGTTYYPAGCNTGTDNCCICADARCSTNTQSAYTTCLASCPTSSKCCVNPCLCADGSTAASKIASSSNKVSAYTDCMNKANEFSAIKDTSCCGGFNCSYCNFSAGSSDLTNILCVDVANKENDCYVCNNSACDDSTSTEYIVCNTNIAFCGACCVDPCIGAPTNYFNCISNTTVDATYGNKYVDRLCCASAPTCADCGADPCIHPDSRCSNATDNGGCCKCKDNRCKDSTSTEYIVCNTNIAFCGACCVDPCISKPTITTVAQYKACLANATYGPSGADCCGGFLCSYCDFSAGSSDLTDILCVNAANKENDCYNCNNTICSHSTPAEYIVCNANIAFCGTCCVDPCLGMPAVDTIEKWRKCELSKTGAINEYTQFTSAQCSCGDFNCSLCGVGICNPDILCQSIACCVCKDPSCKTAKKIEYDACRLNNTCRDSGCCINPCIGVPKGYTECMRSPFANLGCCKREAGPCDLCPFCLNGCSTPQLYSQCVNNYTCNKNKCCVDMSPVIPVCDECSPDCNSCFANATCVNNGCCSGFNCSNITCPNTATIEGWDNCMLNGCCKNLGCCGPSPCLTCPSDHRTCIQNTSCNDAGCCGPPQPCDTCANIVDRITCWKTCGADPQLKHCCPGGPCDGCLDSNDGSTWYTCMDNQDCLDLQCCGLAPCITQDCFSRTKPEYISCRNDPKCNPPIQDEAHDCCVDPCVGCSDNYFDCITNPACVSALCCAPAPTCVDCVGDPCLSTHIECSKATDNGGCCKCKDNRCKDSTKPEYDICNDNIQFCGECCVDPCIDAPTNYFDCLASLYVGKLCCSFDCASCGPNPCTSTQGQCSLSPDQGGCCNCASESCSTSNKTQYDLCLRNPLCDSSSCCINPCIGAPTNYFDCVNDTTIDSVYGNTYAVRGCCPSVPSCADCGSSPCSHADPRCSNSSDATGTRGCCNCKSNRCKDSTRSQYQNCRSEYNLLYCDGCCDSPCTGCGQYKTSEYYTCSQTAGCASKGCCNRPALDPCDGCKTSNCSNDAICVANMCCRAFPPCDTSECPAEYLQCMATPGCPNSGCCPPNPCHACNTERSVEGYAECITSNELLHCIAYNCCQDPCDVCANMLYSSCMTDVYCLKNGCCPQEPCSMCEEKYDNYEDCTKDPICDLYCCCKDV